METEEPFGRVTKELVMESIEIKEFNEQQRWWITPVSSIQEFDEKEKVGNEKVEKKYIPLKLDVEGPGCCNSGEAWALPWSYELKRACWHWVEVKALKTESEELDPSYIVELVWFTWTFVCWVLDLNLYPGG